MHGSLEEAGAAATAESGNGTIHPPWFLLWQDRLGKRHGCFAGSLSSDKKRYSR